MKRIMLLVVSLATAFAEIAVAQPVPPTGPSQRPQQRPSPGFQRPDRPQIQPPRPGRPDVRPPRPGRPEIQPPRPGRPDVRPPRPPRPRPPGIGRPPRPPFVYPGGYHYRRWHPGLILPGIFLASTYYILDYHSYGVSRPPRHFRWVRYGPDLVLVNTRTGRIRDVRYGVFG